MSTVTQEQLNRFFEIINASLLPSELDELLTLDDSGLHLAINSGTNDAKKIKVPLLRGIKGDYDASTNTPPLVDGIGVEGDIYYNTVAGSNDYGSGVVDVLEGDIILYISGKWKVLNDAPEITTMYKEVPPETPDGITTNFTTVNEAIGSSYIWVYMNGVSRTDFKYNASLKEVQMTFAPTLGTDIVIHYMTSIALGSDDISSLETRVDNLEDNQVTGVEVYTEKTDLPPTGTLLTSYKVTNDTVTSANNGYYHWDGATYIKDADLAIGVVTDGDTDAVSGGTVTDALVPTKLDVGNTLIENAVISIDLAETFNQLLADDGSLLSAASADKIIKRQGVAAGEVYKLKGYVKNTKGSSISLFAFYAASSYATLVQNGDIILAPNDDLVVIDKEITIPAGVAHIKISNPDGSNVTLTEVTTVSTNKTDIDANTSTINNPTGVVEDGNSDNVSGGTVSDALIPLKLQDGNSLIENATEIEGGETFSQLIADDGSLYSVSSANKIIKYTVAENEVYKLKGYIKNTATNDVSLYAFYANNTYASLVSVGTIILANLEDETVIHEITIPVGATHLKISNPEGSNVVLTEVEGEKSTLVDRRTEYKHFRSAEMVIPFMYKDTVEWQEGSRVPRFNALNATDWNESETSWEEIINWNELDNGVGLGLSCIIATGDLISSTKITKAVFTSRVDTMFNAINTTNDIPVLFCNGNHDLGEDGNMDNITDVAQIPSAAERKVLIFDRMYDRLTPTQQANLTGLTGDTMYYYYDFASQKTRLIALNDYEAPYVLDGSGIPIYSGTAEDNGTTTQRNTYYTKAQLDFLYAALLSTPNDYNVVVMNHQGLNEFYAEDNAGDGNLGRSLEALRELLAAFKTRTSGTANATAITGAAAYSVVYDFTARTDSHIMVVNGHYHEFKHIVEAGAGNIDVIQCISLYGVTSYLKFTDSVSEVSADMLSIDYDTNELYVLRYGQTRYRGSDAVGDGTGSDEFGFHFVTTPIQL